VSSRSKVAVTTALDDVDVECTHCGVTMTMQHTAGSRVRYFHCPSCNRWVSSTYTEIFRGDSKLKPAARRADTPAPFSLENVRSRLESWLSALEDQNPYRVLGVSPSDSTEQIRERYRELARAAHPDHGGSQARMQVLNAAYERVLEHRAQRHREAVAPAV
jgi:DnaJ domain